MNNLTATLKISSLSEIRTSDMFIQASDLSSSIDNLNSRLSGISICSTATSSDVVSALSAIISKFGGN